MRSCAELLELPQSIANAEPIWLGFPITIKECTGVQRADLLAFLAESKIETRQLFVGNLTRQPYFQGVQYRVVGALTKTDRIMNNTFWLGVHAGLDQPQLDHIIAKLESFFGLTF